MVNDNIDDNDDVKIAAKPTRSSRASTKGSMRTSVEQSSANAKGITKKRMARRKSDNMMHDADDARLFDSTITPIKPVIPSIDWFSVFPNQRIKAQLQENDRIGPLSKDAVSMIGACTAAMLTKLIHVAAATTAAGTKETTTAATISAVSETIMVTNNHLLKAIEKNDSFDFLRGVLDDIKDDPNYGNLCSKKLVMSKSARSSTNNSNNKKRKLTETSMTATNDVDDLLENVTDNGNSTKKQQKRRSNSSTSSKVILRTMMMDPSLSMQQQNDSITLKKDEESKLLIEITDSSHIIQQPLQTEIIRDDDDYD